MEQHIPDISNPDLINVVDLIRQVDSTKLSQLPHFHDFSEVNNDIITITKPQLVLTSKDVYTRILRDFKSASSKTNRGSSTHTSTLSFVDKSLSPLTNISLPDRVFQPTTSESDSPVPIPFNLENIQVILGKEISLVSCPDDELTPMMYALVLGPIP